MFQMLNAAANFAKDMYQAREARKAASADRSFQAEANHANYMQQKEFAQHGIRWKMDDAKAAGIHPMYAMGATGATASASYQAQKATRGGSSMGAALRGLSNAGSQISREMQNTELNDLQKSLIRSQIGETDANTENVRARTAAQQGYNQPTNVPDGTIANLPSETISTNPGQSHVQAGTISSVQFMKTKTGLSPVQSENAKERLEEDVTGNLMWQWNNRIAPKTKPDMYTVHKSFPHAIDVRWNQWAFEWVPIYPGDKGSNPGYTELYSNPLFTFSKKN